MLPSDHFVKMYNELFKMLEEKGHKQLQKYWLAIAELQETIIGPCIKKDGLKGMYNYWERIRIEENSDADLTLHKDYFEFKVNVCPSLSKVMDNNAGQFVLYCDHCAGWVEPVMEKYGYTCVCDMVSRTKPQCVFRIYQDKKKAVEFRQKVKLLAEPYK